jgi:hypothetical protein
MRRLRQLLAPELEVYAFAVDNYQAQWDKDLQTC